MELPPGKLPILPVAKRDTPDDDLVFFSKVVRVDIGRNARVGQDGSEKPKHLMSRVQADPQGHFADTLRKGAPEMDDPGRCILRDSHCGGHARIARLGGPPDPMPVAGVERTSRRGDPRKSPARRPRHSADSRDGASDNACHVRVLRHRHLPVSAQSSIGKRKGCLDPRHPYSME